MTEAGRHERAVANTLGLARDAAARGDFAGALEWLGFVEIVDGVLPAGWEQTRVLWLRGRPLRRGGASGPLLVGPPPGWGRGVAEEGVARQGKLAPAISNAVVQELASTTGRGPTQAKTTMGDNAVFVVLQDTLTRGKRSLVGAGESEAVLDLRRRWQKVMRAGCSRKIEELTGRAVVGFMSDNHIDPDIAVEVFILDPLGADPAAQAASAVAEPVRG
jgi:uncharacterized protein YbcI